MTPTALQSGPYRFFVLWSDRQEPPHIHVKREDELAWFWLASVREASNYGFSPRELNYGLLEPGELERFTEGTRATIESLAKGFTR